mgnify:FL=1
MKKKIATLLAALLVIGGGSLSVLAAQTVDMPFGTTVNVYDDDGDHVSGFEASDGRIIADYVSPGKEYYFELPGDDEPIKFNKGTLVTVADITDNDNFSFKLDRDKNGKLLDSVSFVSKRFDGQDRKDYIKVDLEESNMTEDKKLTFDVYFKAKHSEEGKWGSGDRVNIRFEMWVNNDVEDGEDADFEVGEDIVFNPISNETNIITWGDNYDVASLKFEANDDADKFYAKLSTKSNAQIYRDYGDPADADLFFRTFVGSPSIDSTSRATLTLYNPWSQDDDDDYDVDPYDVYIYEVDSGELTDISDRFIYVDGDDTETGTDGWQIKIRTLGNYVLSDTPLDTYYEDDDIYVEEPVNEIVPEVPTKPNPAPVPAPPTGSSDLVGIASFGAIVSLGTVVLLKKRK